MFQTRYKSHHDAEHCYREHLKRDRSSIEEVYEYLDNNNIKAKDNAIYIHVPFCDRICSFCNMNRTITNDKFDSYANDLIGQIENMGKLKAYRDANISSVFFGGGTPTTLSPLHFEKIVKTLKENFNLDDNCEISCETTVHNLSEEHIDVFNKVGINRISIGIQTFQTEGRKFFNRTFSKEEVISRLKIIMDKFNGFVCVDKIYNYPGETMEKLLDDVRQIIDLKVDSVSFYSLMIHKGSHLSTMYDEHNFSDEADLMFHDAFVNTILESNEYEMLELTKIARKNTDKYKYMEVRNNNGNTIPLGRGAGGKIDDFHIYNMDFNRIMVAKSTQEYEDSAHCIYGAFQKHIIDKDFIKELPFVDDEFLFNEIDKYIDLGYIIEDKDKYELSLTGIFYGNNIGGFLTKSFLESVIMEESVI